jgi:ankyrin repeat protein
MNMNLSIALHQYYLGIKRKDFAAAEVAMASVPEKSLTQWANEPYGDQGNALHLAVKSGSLALVQAIVKLGVSVDATDNAGFTPLMHAMNGAYWSIVDFLIEQGAKTAIATTRKTPLLWLALRHKDGLIYVKRFIQEGQSLHGVSSEGINDNGSNALFFAAESGSVESMDYVLANLPKGSPVSLMHINSNGERVIDYCTSLPVFNHLKTLAPKLEPIAIFKNKITTLHRFAQYGTPELLEATIPLAKAAGITLNQKGYKNNTPMHWASRSENAHRIDNIRILLAAGAKVDPRNSYNYTPLHWATECGYLDVVELLVENKANLNAKTSTQFIINEFRTPLWFAVEEKHIDVLKYLLARGADPNVVCNSSCDTPLSNACASGELEMVDLLLKHGASPNGIDRENDPYFYFPLAKSRRPEITKRLIDAGAEVNARSRYGDSALHNLVGSVDKDSSAEFIDHVAQCMQLLIDAGADVQLTDDHGRTPLSQTKHPKLVAVLMSARNSGAAPKAIGDEEAERQTKKNNYQSTIRGVVSLMTGKDADAMDAVFNARHGVSETSIGPELYRMANQMDSNEQLQSLLQLLEHATQDDVRYINPDSYDNQETILYRVIESLDHSSYHETLSWSLAYAVIDMLLKKGADANAIETLWCSTPLHCIGRTSLSGFTQKADLDGCKRIVMRLLDEGANPTIGDESGAAALDCVHPDLIADMAARGCVHGKSHRALISAVIYSDSFELADQLISLHSKGVNLPDHEGKTPLMHAIMNPHGPNHAAELFKRGADVMLHDKKGMNAFMYGASELKRQALEILFAAIQDKQPSLLYKALNAVDKTGATALGYVLSSEYQGIENWRDEREAIALLFIQHGARLDIKDKEGSTMADYSATKKLRTACEKLAKSLVK